jgi:hypothetical protein
MISMRSLLNKLFQRCNKRLKYCQVLEITFFDLSTDISRFLLFNIKSFPNLICFGIFLRHQIFVEIINKWNNINSHNPNFFCNFFVTTNYSLSSRHFFQNSRDFFLSLFHEIIGKFSKEIFDLPFILALF